MMSWLAGGWGEAVRCVCVALKVGPTFDGWRTRARAIDARSLRPVFVVFMGLTLVQMLSGCSFSSERPDLAVDVPPKYGAGQGEAAPPVLDWWRGFRSSELTNLIEEAQIANFDIAAGDRAHPAGRRAGQDCRRAAAARGRFRRFCRALQKPGRGRA
jgi:hypothetical protein